MDFPLIIPAYMEPRIPMVPAGAWVLKFWGAVRVMAPPMILKLPSVTLVSIDGTPVDNIVHVPREAVVRGGTSNRVVVDRGDGVFESRTVLVGIESGDRVAIRRGLNEGERVVVSAQFLIDSESNIGSALGRLESPQ